MEFSYRATYEQASSSSHRSQSSNYTNYTQQSLGSNYANPDYGRNYYFHGNGAHIDVQQEMIQRQLEKDRIREEIIAAEMSRRRQLEAEVLRELAAERELEMRCRLDGSHKAPPYSYHAESARSLEERIAFSLQERHKGFPSARFESFEEEMPFQRSSQPQITESKPHSEVGNQKEKETIIFLGKPNANISGTKRKAETPPKGNSSELLLSGLKTKPKDEWSCAICQVSATSERGLNEHLQGKKHKAKEAGLRAQGTGRNFSIGLCIKKTENSTKRAKVNENPNSRQGGKTKGKSPQPMKTGSSTNLKILNLGCLKKNEAPFLQQEDEANKKSGAKNKKMKFKFWCEMCQAGAFSEKVMNNHKKGKKHVSRLQKLDEKCEPATQPMPGTQMVEVTWEANEEEIAQDGGNLAPNAGDGKADIVVEVNNHLALHQVSGGGSNRFP